MSYKRFLNSWIKELDKISNPVFETLKKELILMRDEYQPEKDNFLRQIYK